MDLHANPLVITNQETRAILGREGDALADTDPRPVATGIDRLTGDHSSDHHAGDLFPVNPDAGVMAVALSSHHDADPLVALPAADLVPIADGLEDHIEPTSHDVAAWEALHQPIDHAKPLDHIDWNVSGLLS